MDDVLEIHFIEMNKFIKQWHAKKLDPWNDILARWLLLLGMVDVRKKKVYKEIYAYEARLKYILDEEARLDDARYLAEKEGLKKGLERGLEQGLEKGKLLEKEETVKRLFKLSLTIEQIAEATSLNSAVVERIIKELNNN